MGEHPPDIGWPPGEQAEGLGRLEDQHAASRQRLAATGTGTGQQFRLQRPVDDVRNPHLRPQQLLRQRHSGLRLHPNGGRVDQPVGVAHLCGQIAGVDWPYPVRRELRAQGERPYRLTSGRLPRGAGEVALGPRSADELGVGIGDRVTMVGPSGLSVSKRVSGVVELPTLEAEPLGRNLLMPQDALRLTAVSQGYANVLVRAVDPAAAASLRTELASTLEIEQPSAPSTVVALGKLAAPARLIVIVLVLAAILLVGEYVTLLLRRRGTQLAIAASIGMNRRQLIAAIASAAVATAVVAVVVGVPLGWAVSRLVLVELGPRLGVDLAGPGVLSALLVAVAGVVVAVAVGFALSTAGLSRRRLADLRGREANG